MTDPRLPEPPELHQTRLILGTAQWIGLPLILLVVILAAAGAFGERWERARMTGSGIDARVEYPSRFRYKMINSVVIDVRNTSRAAIDTIRVRVDTAYLARFSTLMFVPSAEHVYEIPLVDVRPGETRRATIEIQAEQYGRHEGRLSIAAGPDSISTMLRTTIFP